MQIFLEETELIRREENNEKELKLDEKNFLIVVYRREEIHEKEIKLVEKNCLIIIHQRAVIKKQY